MPSVPSIDFAKQEGLVPCIAQDARTGRVLMLAYMNEEALKATLETGWMHYWSRSREELWRKGATSGNTQRLVGLNLDCDQDTLLALVDQNGPACHTGEPACFFTTIQGDRLPVLNDLWGVIEDRARKLPEGSWTTRLLTEEGLVEEKVLEEVQEVVEQTQQENPLGDGDGLVHELADLVYHALVLANKHGATMEDVLGALQARRA